MEVDLTAPAAPRRSLAALARLRQKLRGLFLRDGLVTIAGAVLLALALSFLLDYALVLPRAVRFVFLVLAGVGLLGLFKRRVAEPLSTPVTDVDLANLVERANPALAQSLITAVELTRDGSEAAAHVSGALLDSVVRGVEERVGEIGFDRIFDLRRLRRKSWLAAALALVTLGGALLNTDLAAIWLRRNVLLGAERWPKQTVLALLKPDPTVAPTLVAMGDDLDLEVRAIRGEPPSVYVDSFVGGRLLRSDPLVQTGSGLYQKRLENVTKPFSFNVRGGDDEIGRFDVDVRLRPRIEMSSIRLWCAFPAYTGLESTPEDQPLRHGNLKVPEGTVVRYRMASNVDVSKVYFVLRGTEAPGTAPKPGEAAPATWPEAGAIELPVAGEREFGGELIVKESGQYYFQLEAKDGFRSVRPDRFRVEAVADQKPIVKVLEPERQNEEVTADARIVVRVSASDDYGIQKAVLEGVYFAPGKKDGTPRHDELPRFAASPKDAAAAAAAAGRKPIEDELTLEIAKLESGSDGPPAPGGRYQYWAQALDLGGHVGESQIYFLQVVEKDDLLRILTDQLMIVRDQLREALRRQKSARKDLEDFQSPLALREKIPPEEASKLFRHRQDQGRVTQALEREAGEVSRILQRTTRNNVGDEQWKGWVSGIRDDVVGLAQKKSPEIERSIEGIQKESSQSPPEVSRLNVVTSGQREVEREIESIVMRLSEFGDKNALIQMLRELRRRESELREGTRDRAKGTPAVEPQK